MIIFIIWYILAEKNMKMSKIELQTTEFNLYLIVKSTKTEIYFVYFPTMFKISTGQVAHNNAHDFLSSRI